MSEPHALVGLSRGTVRIDSHSADWSTAFEVEKRTLLSRLGPRLLRIEHIGSTAVPGLAAKPLIDMQAAVPPLSGLDSVLTDLAELGYCVMPERWYAGRFFLPKGPESHRTHHLNLVLSGSDDWLQPLMFRDRLRADHRSTSPLAKPRPGRPPSHVHAGDR